MKERVRNNVYSTEALSFLLFLDHFDLVPFDKMKNSNVEGRRSPTSLSFEKKQVFSI